MVKNPQYILDPQTKITGYVPGGWATRTITRTVFFRANRLLGEQRDRCPVPFCPVCQSVTLVYYGQTTCGSRCPLVRR